VLSQPLNISTVPSMGKPGSFDVSLADCAAALSLFYADWIHQLGDAFPQLRAYRSRLLARPSFARAIEEGRKYRSYFPRGAPDRN
jgi:glutathione S-transferase